jgi:hypothetical protein
LNSRNVQCSNFVRAFALRSRDTGQLSDNRHAFLQCITVSSTAIRGAQNIFPLTYAPIKIPYSKEIHLSKIARRQFIQLSAVAAAGCLARPGNEAKAQDMPKIEESDPIAQSLKYVHDAGSVDPAQRANPAAEQDCANCALVQGADGDAWRPCQIFPGKLVNADGWCSVWAPKP